VLDGALGTELERRGASLKTRLWSAALLCGTEDQRELVRQVHLDYLRCAPASEERALGGSMLRDSGN